MLKEMGNRLSVEEKEIIERMVMQGIADGNVNGLFYTVRQEIENNIFGWTEYHELYIVSILKKQKEI